MTLMNGSGEIRQEATDRIMKVRGTKLTKLVYGKYGGRKETPGKDLQGGLIITERDQEACWEEHFKDVLNRLPQLKLTFNRLRQTWM